MEENCWEQDVPAIMCQQDMYPKDEQQQQQINIDNKAATPMAMSAYPQFGYTYHPTSPAAPQSGVSPSSTGAVSPTPGSPCCEGGRPVLSDPASGQTVCSCQYDHPTRLALSSYPRPSVYSAHYPSTEQNPYPSIDSSAFYSPLSTPYGLKDGTAGTEMSPWAGGLQPSSGYYPYDPTLAAYGYGAGYDLAARRKNATRESTATLKAWLNEHKKNPYPTKGEKIMLAIITKMTLTQVSTWFANARRRLKKENKMTWEPKNKTDDDDEAALSDCEDKDKEDCDQEKDPRIPKDPLLHVKAEQRLKELEEEDEEEDERKADHHHLLPPHHMFKEELSKDCGVPVPATKPKIWSLADTAACKTPPPSAGWGYRAYYYPEVQADTPPQTPPSMKLPYQGYQGHPGYFPSAHRSDHHQPQHQEETAFKPFYKSLSQDVTIEDEGSDGSSEEWRHGNLEDFLGSSGQVSGGFVSPV